VYLAGGVVCLGGILSIVWLKRDVALVAICGIFGGVIYAAITHQ
jgi:hypothetical protein